MAAMLFDNSISGPDSIKAVACSGDGKLVASAVDDKTLIVTGGADQSVALWDVLYAPCEKTLTQHGYSVTAVAFSPDGTRVATASNDKTIKLWNPAYNVCYMTLKGHEAWVTTIAFGRDGNQLLSVDDEHIAKLWRVIGGTTCDVTLDCKGNADVICTACSRGTKYVASGTSSGTVLVWDVRTRTLKTTLTVSASKVTALAFSPDSVFLAVGCAESVAYLCIADLTRAVTLTGHAETVTSIVFSQQGDRLVTASEDCTAKLWRVADGVCLATLRGHRQIVTAAVFSHDTTMVATSSFDGTARLWCADTGRFHAMVAKHDDVVTSVAFNHNSSVLATSSWDKTAKLWKVPPKVVASSPCLGTSAHSAPPLPLLPDNAALPPPPVHPHKSAPAIQSSPSTMLWSSLLAHKRLETECQTLTYRDCEGILFSDSLIDPTHPCFQFVASVATPTFMNTFTNFRVEMVGLSATTATTFSNLHHAEGHSRGANVALQKETPKDDASIAGLEYLKKKFIPVPPSHVVGDEAPKSRIVLAWHGTHTGHVSKVCRDGPRDLRKTDCGFFGAGSYFAFEAEYAARYCRMNANLATAECAVILFAVSVSQVKVITLENDYRTSESVVPAHLDGFSQYYSGKKETSIALAPGCDAHFVPVKYYGTNHPIKQNYVTAMDLDYQAVNLSTTKAAAHELVIAHHSRCVPLAVIYFRSK